MALIRSIDIRRKENYGVNKLWFFTLCLFIVSYPVVYSQALLDTPITEDAASIAGRDGKQPPDCLIPISNLRVSADNSESTNQSGTTTEKNKLVWTFTVIAGISQTTANYYGGFQAAKNLILDQFATINNRFNTPNVFNGTFQFSVDSIYEFTGNPVSEIFVAHPNHSYRVIYDGFPTQGGGWYGSPVNAIHHSWSVSDFGGTFSDFATDGIVHEFGHSRGAIDLYALQVNAGQNPINGEAYQAAISIMNYPYGETAWDLHSINVINTNYDSVWASLMYITNSFPSSMGIVVKDAQGVPLQNSEIKLYPVSWFSSSVNSIPTIIGSTNSLGGFVFSTNPFGPRNPRPNCGKPWCINYPNFLVSIKYLTLFQYRWLPITDVQNFYFASPSSPYTLNVVMPTSVSKGDLNTDGVLSPSDVVSLLNCVFLNTGGCHSAVADVNCDSNLTPADVVLELNAVFLDTSFPC